MHSIPKQVFLMSHGSKPVNAFISLKAAGVACLFDVQNLQITNDKIVVCRWLLRINSKWDAVSGLAEQQ